MGVDNNAILFVGLPASEINGEYLEAVCARCGFTTEDWEEYVDDCLQKINVDGLGYRNTSEYHDEGMLVGFTIGNSGSYGIIQIEDAKTKINHAQSTFMEVFGIMPKTYLYNYQW